MNRAVYNLQPIGMDAFDARTSQYKNYEVQIVQPFGCPKNGTMGMVYVQLVKSGELIGLVLKASLVKTCRTAPVRDLAAEARDKRSQRRVRSAA